MLAAFAEAAPTLDREDYREVTERNADFLLRELRQENGRLLRTWKRRPMQGEGTGEAKLNSCLEDYGFLIEGLLELYQTTFQPRWVALGSPSTEAPAVPLLQDRGVVNGKPQPTCAAISRVRRRFRNRRYCTRS